MNASIDLEHLGVTIFPRVPDEVPVSATGLIKPKESIPADYMVQGG